MNSSKAEPKMVEKETILRVLLFSSLRHKNLLLLLSGSSKTAAFDTVWIFMFQEAAVKL